MGLPGKHLFVCVSSLTRQTFRRISGGATVWHLGKLYLVGGYTVEYDVELKSFYQNPANTGIKNNFIFPHEYISSTNITTNLMLGIYKT